MIELARAAGKAVLIDPKGSDYERYAGATVITPNRGELAQVIGAWSSESQLYERVQALRAAHRLAALLLTRSEEGMSLFDDSRLHARASADARGIRCHWSGRYGDRHAGGDGGERHEPA